LKTQLTHNEQMVCMLAAIKLTAESTKGLDNPQRYQKELGTFDFRATHNSRIRQANRYCGAGYWSSTQLLHCWLDTHFNGTTAKIPSHQATELVGHTDQPSANREFEEIQLWTQCNLNVAIARK
jgi:hypothetical protein